MHPSQGSVVSSAGGLCPHPSYASHVAAAASVGLPHHHHPHPHHHCPMDFKSYVARIIWEADNDSLALPLDTYRVYCIEGEAASSVGSLSSLGSALAEATSGADASADFSYESLRHWGPKFEGLSEMYRRPELAAIAYREPSVRSPTPTQAHGQAHSPLPQQLQLQQQPQPQPQQQL